MASVDLKSVERILRETFPTAVLNSSVRELKLGDIEEWDSLGNFNLLLAFEESYGIRFSMDEMGSLRSIAEIIDALERK